MGTQFQLMFIQRFKGKVLFNVPMREYTSIGIGGPADVMAFPKNEADLKDLLSFADSKKFPVHVFGSGTDILVRDGGIRGVVVNMSEGFKDVSWKGDTWAECGAGVGLARLVEQCRERGLSGIEFAAGIPGTVGGAVTMNAGAYGGEMQDVVDGVEVLGRKGKKGFISKADIGFDYRKTALPKGSVITRAHMSFKKKGVGEIEERIKEVRGRRKLTSPIKFPNAGSVFKNPAGEAAGKLIEEVGLKGERVGDAQISEVHANYIVNRGRAEARDVLTLMARVRDSVYSMKGIVLEPEIKVVGEE
ncbi:MAG: UDP-N-acetylmuramate dehydrogenase [Thermodesulfobacteriota bacterium]